MQKSLKKGNLMKFQNLVKQAQEFQKKMKEMQEELKNKIVEATAGGGMVTVTANGQQEIISIKIEPEVVNPKDIEMLEDLILAAVNEAKRKAEELAKDEMKNRLFTRFNVNLEVRTFHSLGRYIIGEVEKEVPIVSEIIGDKENGQDEKYWMYYVNEEMPMVAADKKEIKAEDKVEFRFEKSAF